MQEDSGQEELIPVTPSEISYRLLNTEEVDNPGALKPSADLVDSIRLYGVIDPIRVERGNGTYRIKDGARRHLVVLRFLEEAKAPDEPDPDEVERWSVIPCVIEESDPIAGDATRIVGHAVRRSNAIVELEVIEHYLDDNRSESEIHRLTKLPVGTIRKRLKLRGLDPVVRSAAREGRVSPSVAEKVATLSEDQQSSLAKNLEDEKGKITAEDVREVRTAVHQDAITAAFEDEDEEEEQESPPREPSGPHEYAQGLAYMLRDFAEEVVVGKPRKEDARTAYIYMNHENPDMQWRLKVERRR